MRYYIFFIAVLLLNCSSKDKTFGNKPKKEVSQIIEKETINLSIDNNSDKKEDTPFIDENGFLFIDIGTIYFKGGSLSILDEKKDTIAFFKNKNAFINGKKYETIEDSGFYKQDLVCTSFDPEYSLFIMKYEGLEGNYFKVVINGKTAFIDREHNKELVTIKSTERYIMESFPKLSLNTHLRKQPNEKSEKIENYLDFTYIPVKIEGDWLKVKDDKNCFIDEPSKTDIIGWLRWRKDGEIIIDVAHSC